MEFLAEYGLFLLKAITVVVSFIVILAAIAAQALKSKHGDSPKGELHVIHVNKKYEDYEEDLKHSILDKDAWKEEKKAAKKEKKSNDKKQKKEKAKAQNRLFVIDFEGDVKASAVESLREEVTAILMVAQKDDEVVVNVESAGGMVHTYGLAASQLQRIRDHGISLTVCIDKVAASGGYLMACVADRILAAPFAIVGSIGVLAQIPNFHRLLKKHDIDYNIMTAGEYKAPVTMFGQITDKGRDKLQKDLEDTHVLFKDFIAVHRDQINLDEVATGEIWYGKQAIAHQLVDEIMTSDSFLMKEKDEKVIYQVAFTEKKSLPEKLGLAAKYGVNAAIGAVFKQEQESQITSKIS